MHELISMILVYYDQSHNNFASSQDQGIDGVFDNISLMLVVVEDAVDPDHIIQLDIDFDVTTNGINRGMSKSLSIAFPKTPTLNSLLYRGNYSLDTQVYGPQT